MSPKFTSRFEFLPCDLERGSEEGKEKRNGEEGGNEVVDDHETSSDFCRRDLLEE